MRLFRDREDVGDGRDEEGVVGDDRRAVDRAVKLDFAEDFFLATGGEDDEFAVLGAAVNFTIGDEGGGPDAAIGGMHPEGLAGLGVEAGEDPSVLDREHEVPERDR